MFLRFGVIGYLQVGILPTIRSYFKSACTDYSQPAQAGFAPVDAVSNRRMNPPDTLAIGNRADTIQVRRRGLPQPAQAGFVPVDAVSNRRMNPPDETAGCNPPDESKNIPPTAYLRPTRNIDY
jgi:hypothetical protein